jgi:hypothetical protein
MVDFNQELRYRCRECLTNLKKPVENDRKAFCCRGCYLKYYRFRCVVCEASMLRHNEQHQTCERRICRYQIKKYPDQYAFGRRGRSWMPLKDLAMKETPVNKVLLSTTNSDKGWRQVAGPPLSASAFHCAIVGRAVLPSVIKPTDLPVVVHGPLAQFNDQDWKPVTSSDGVTCYVKCDG